MSKHVLRCVAVVLVLAGAGCRFLLDEAEGLAYDLRDGATRLSRSAGTEMIVEYRPPNDLEYTVRFEPSERQEPPYHSVLVVGPDWVGSTMGSHTSYHSRFVYVPRRLYVKKRGASTRILLKKHDDRIEVAAVW